MTVQTLRPSATFSAPAQVVPVGAASLHACLNDDSDASYARYDVAGYAAGLDLTDLVALPTGSVVNGYRSRLRQGGAAPGHRWGITLHPAPLTPTNDVFASTLAVTTITNPWVGAALTTAQINALQAYVQVVAGYSDEAGLAAYELYVDIRYVIKPVVVVNTPTGTIHNTNQPVIDWTNTLDADGGGATRAKVRVFTAAQYGIGGFNPETSPATWEYDGDDAMFGVTPTPLLNATYRAYVKVAQTVNGALHWSDWAFTGFVVNVDAPEMLFSLTATAEPTLGRIRLNRVYSGTGATPTHSETERSLDGGVTWLPFRNAGALGGIIPGGNENPTYDYEAPNGVTVYYRVRALTNYSGLYAAGPWRVATSAWSAPRKWWLKCPNRPALNAIVELVTYGEIKRTARRGVFQPYGASLSIVIEDTRGGAEGRTVFRAKDAAALAALKALFDAKAVLLLQGPLLGGEPDRYLSVGDVVATRVVDTERRHLRDVSADWNEVTQPLGGTA